MAATIRSDPSLLPFGAVLARELERDKPASSSSAPGPAWTAAAPNGVQFAVARPPPLFPAAGVVASASAPATVPPAAAPPPCADRGADAGGRRR